MVLQIIKYLGKESFGVWSNSFADYKTIRRLIQIL